MRMVREAGVGLLFACLPLFGGGCASLSPKLTVLPSLARHRAESQYQAARQAEQQGQLQKARELYAALQRQSPNTPDYAHRMGVVCTQLQDYLTAGKYFEHARSLDPRNAALLADIGYSAYLQKDYANAEVLLSESVQLKPADPRAVNNLAMAIGFQGRYDESLAMFRRTNAETQSLLNVAFIQSQRNDPETAMATYARVLSNEPGNRIATSALQQLNQSYPRQPPAPPVNEPALAATGVPPQISIVPAWSPDPTPPPAEGLIALIDVDDVPPLPAVIVSAGDLPSPSPSSAPPLVTPLNVRWAATQAAKPEETPITASAESEFERPKRAEPPQELFAEPERLPAASQPAVPTDDMSNAFEGDDNGPELHRSGGDELTGVEWTKDDLAKAKAAAESGSPTLPEHTDSLRGFCPVALRDERRLTPAFEEFSAEFRAQTYRFSSEEARSRFLAHPEWYVPAAGGSDVVDAKRSRVIMQGSLDFACWFRRRLHMFGSAENLAAFRATPRDFIASP